MKRSKRWIALVLVLSMVLPMINITVYAGGVVSEPGRWDVYNPNGVTGEDIVEQARKYSKSQRSTSNNFDYRTGYATTPPTFDCSGLVCRVTRDLGLVSTNKADNYPANKANAGNGYYYITSDTHMQKHYGKDLSEELEKLKNGDSSAMRPGDLIFFDYNGDKVTDHVGIYSGDGNIIESLSAEYPWVEWPMTSNLKDGGSHAYWAYAASRLVDPCNHNWNSAGICSNSKCGYKFQYEDTFKTDSAAYYKANRDINTYEEPYAAAKKTPVKYKKGDKVTVLGSVTNAHEEKDPGNHRWYKIQINGSKIAYVFSGHLNYYAQIPSKITCTVSSPSGTITAGKSLPVKGVITSDHTINYVAAGVYDSSGAVVLPTVSTNPGKSQFSLENSTIDYGLKFQNLTRAGNYTLKIYVKDSNGAAKTFEFPFAAGQTAKPACSAPVISAQDSSGGKTVSISTATAGATIYYTTDGSNPANSGKQYTGSFSISASTQVRALAVKSGMIGTEGQPSYITVNPVALPSVGVTYGPGYALVAMQCSTSGARISWSYDNLDYKAYDGPVKITRTDTIWVKAYKDGMANSEVITQEITLRAPGTPKVRLEQTEDRLAVGKVASWSWSRDPLASEYMITVEKDGEVYRTETLMESTYSLKLDEIGYYSLSVSAVNTIGSSTQSEAVFVTAMPPSTVTIQDYDGSLLQSVEVEYGGYIQRFSAPKRRGYDFAGWQTADGYTYDHKDITKINVLEDLTLTACYDRTIYKLTLEDVDGTILPTVEVPYESPADLPAYTGTIPVGYTFAGWEITEVTEPDSRCDLSYIDSDMKLKAVIVWADAELPVSVEIGRAVRDGSEYSVPVTFYNWPDAESSIYVRVSLKNSDNATGADKLLYTDRRIMTLAAGETKTENVVLNYTGDAAEVEVLVLEYKDDQNTGSAYSKSVTAAVVSNTYYTEPSAWSTTKPTEKAGRLIESKTQYRYRDKETTTSSSSTLSGWTYDKSTWTWSNYGSWSNWSENKVSSNSSTNVETRTAYHYYYYVCSYCGAHMHGYGNCYTWAGGCGRNTIYSNSYHAVRYPAAYTQAVDFHGTGVHYKYTDEGLAFAYISPSSGYYVGPVTQYRYQTRSQIYTYYFYRWGSWSSWGDQSYSSSSSRQVETRTVYRYRDEVLEYQAPSATVDGIVRNFSGTLSVDEDLNGKEATIMVYQCKNTDPNRDQMQYIGQTVIGANNSYEFSFVPQKEPTTESGNYIVALGVKGTTGLLNVGVVEAPRQTYTVTFLDADGNELAVQEVLEGDSADIEAIELPEKIGYQFVGWSDSATDIRANRIIQAKYMPLQYTITFVDWENEMIGFQTAPAGTPIEPPYNPADGSYAGAWFTGWDVLIEDPDAVITDNAVVTAVYTPITYPVAFCNENGDVISLQEVKAGEAAIPPEYPGSEGKVFLGWSTDMAWWDVTIDMEVFPVLALAETTVAPISNIGSYYSAYSATLELQSEPGATIYYTTDGTEPTTESNVYSEPLFFEETTLVFAMACEDGKNDSEVVAIQFIHDETPEDAPVYEVAGLSTKEITVKPGDVIPLEIGMVNNPGLTGCHFIIECDQSVFYLEEYEETGECFLLGDAFANGTAMVAPYEDKGWQVIWFSSETATGDGTVLTLPVCVGEEAEAGVYSIFVGYVPSNTVNAQMEETALSSEHIIFGGAADAVYGDADGNGRLTLADVVLIARYIVGLENIDGTSLQLADVNGDGMVTNVDVIRLARYMIGLETSLR